MFKVSFKIWEHTKFKIFSLYFNWLACHKQLILLAIDLFNVFISVLCMDVDKENLKIVSGSVDSKLCVSSVTPQVCAESWKSLC